MVYILQHLLLKILIVNHYCKKYFELINSFLGFYHVIIFLEISSRYYVSFYFLKFKFYQTYEIRTG